MGLIGALAWARVAILCLVQTAGAIAAAYVLKTLCALLATFDILRVFIIRFFLELKPLGTVTAASFILATQH
jgi:hypothetical protein